MRARGAASADTEAHVDPVLPDVEADPGADTAASTASLVIAGASHAAAHAASGHNGRVGPVARHDPAKPVAVSGAMAVATAGTVP